MVFDDGYEDIRDFIKKAYKEEDASGKMTPKVWCCCQDCIIMGSYEWCPKNYKKNIKTLDAEEGCPMGKSVLN
jgi:hypothetical protein